KRRRSGVRVSARELGRASDAPRVHESLTRVAVVDRGTIDIELKSPGALYEERPLLAEERLECRQIEHAGIRLDLAEVRIDRGVERQVRRDAVFHIAPDGYILRPADAARVELGDVLRHEVGRDLEPSRRFEVVEAV